MVKIVAKKMNINAVIIIFTSLLLFRLKIKKAPKEAFLFQNVLNQQEQCI